MGNVESDCSTLSPKAPSSNANTQKGALHVTSDLFKAAFGPGESEATLASGHMDSIESVSAHRTSHMEDRGVSSLFKAAFATGESEGRLSSPARTSVADDTAKRGFLDVSRAQSVTRAVPSDVEAQSDDMLNHERVTKDDAFDFSKCSGESLLNMLAVKPEKACDVTHNRRLWRKFPLAMQLLEEMLVADQCQRASCEDLTFHAVLAPYISQPASSPRVSMH